MTSPQLLRRLRSEDECLSERAATEARAEMYRQLNFAYRLLDALKADDRIRDILDVKRPRGLDGRVCIDPAVVILDDLVGHLQQARNCQYMRCVHEKHAAIISVTRAAVAPINAVLGVVGKQ